MSAAGGGPAGSAVGAGILTALGIIGGLLGLYIVGFSNLFGEIGHIIGPLFAALGGVCAIVWGADAIRRVASYGLGTGVPSIGYMSLGIGILGALAGLALAHTTLFGSEAMESLGEVGGLLPLLAPILALLVAMLLGLIVALVATKIIKMKIAVLERCTAEIAGAAGLSVLCFSAAIAGSFAFPMILALVVAPGFIALFFILVTMAIQHPFNACLGPNEDQVRTLKLAAATGFLCMVITGLMTIVNPTLTVDGFPAWIVILLVGLIGWIISFKSYVTASLKQAASVKWAGLWPKVEE
jgi:tetrahydromethanopterin S-methyltransferase subunit C